MASILTSTTAIFWAWANFTGGLTEPAPEGAEPDEVERRGEAQGMKGKVVLVTGAARRIGREHRDAGSPKKGLASPSTTAHVRGRGEAHGRRVRRRGAGSSANLEQRARNRANVRRGGCGAFRPAGRPGQQRRPLHPPRSLEITEQDWDSVHPVNLKAVFFCCQAGARLMRQTGGGRIVNISSFGGIRPWAEHVHYCASQAGVIMLTRRWQRPGPGDHRELGGAGGDCLRGPR